MPGARSLLHAETQTLGSFFTAFPGALAGMWVGSRAVKDVALPGMPQHQLQDVKL